MEQIILDILRELRAGRAVDDRVLLKFVHAQAKRDGADKRSYAKRRLLPFYQRVRREEPERWRSWGVTPELEERLLDVLRMKPRRSASGVATITVITKPWPCGSDCLYCPNDVRMPKSYLHGEPACERAEQNFFDPYLQAASRLTALAQMGHATDKIELIVLGGTWTDYPEPYRLWFVRELFRALNEGVTIDGGAAGSGDASADGRFGAADGCVARDGDVAGSGSDAAADSAPRRRARYRVAGFPVGGEALTAFAIAEQSAIDAGRRSYNAAVRALYGESPAWRAAGAWQAAAWESLEREQHANEGARHRVVGLVIETRPDAVTARSLAEIRRLGATKVQMGIQSLDQGILDMNERGIAVGRIREAFELLRAFGFKIHAHAMANLYGSTPEKDKRDYARLVTEASYQPDEVKLYPCALIEGARLCSHYDDGSWQPYTEGELLDVLAADVAATPAFCRISRMIRDFSSLDIKAGNKKPNLRQMVEDRLRRQGGGEDGSLAPAAEVAASAHPDPARDTALPASTDFASSPGGGVPSGIREIRFREVGTGEVDVGSLRLDIVSYDTTNTAERFLQWVTPDGRIAGFLRLSLPAADYIRSHADELPVHEGEAMIREVHVYGMAAGLGQDGRSAQHFGLGRKLVERACELAREAGYARINVISAVGTRAYYRGLGFEEAGLYQRREL